MTQARCSLQLLQKKQKLCIFQSDHKEANTILHRIFLYLILQGGGYLLILCKQSLQNKTIWLHCWSDHNFLKTINWGDNVILRVDDVT